jgi:hypothetical protein
MENRKKTTKFSQALASKVWQEIQKIKNKKSRAGDISKEHFFNHFKTLFVENSAFINNEVEDEFNQKIKA